MTFTDRTTRKRPTRGAGSEPELSVHVLSPAELDRHNAVERAKADFRARVSADQRRRHRIRVVTFAVVYALLMVAVVVVGREVVR